MTAPACIKSLCGVLTMSGWIKCMCGRVSCLLLLVLHLCVSGFVTVPACNKSGRGRVY